MAFVFRHRWPKRYSLPPLDAIAVPDFRTRCAFPRVTAALGSACYNKAMTFMTVSYELQRPLQPEQLRILAGFANTYGLKRFRVDDGNSRLHFEYDASRLRESVVEHVLRSARIPVLRRILPE
jgi:hypothetical protein